MGFVDSKRSIQCHPNVLLSRPTTIRSAAVHHNRKLSASPGLHKKGGKAARDEKQAASKSKDSNDALSDDPFEFSTLEGDIANTIERLKNDLSKLRAGGRFNPEVVENLRVQADKDGKHTAKLNDLAQVIPKGRTVQILVGEQDVGHKLPTNIGRHFI